MKIPRKHTDAKGSIGFLAAEFPTQYLAQLISRLSLYLGVNIIIWGFALVCHAACTTFAGLAICRTLLGVFESYVAPILVLIIALWYKKEQRLTGKLILCLQLSHYDLWRFPDVRSWLC